MVRMTMTFLVMVILFLGGVLVGMNQASQGMIKMRGFESETFQEAVQTRHVDTGKVEVKVLGQDFQQVSMDEKQKKYEELQSSHGIQKVAVTLEKSVQWLYNQMIMVVYQFVQVFF
ncbi:DUF3679 domain-containing protein [Pontibacillus sp. HMF3514]|uniref:DUF3679 domain-containing protein n=1 Tax=Pontibacillus sp. HMF3514 TaxID=2692425 RepID=UPI001320328B|nr:DUF3679 domain-containing protein [Pontibacillus sp. HMF3514]QHE53046.1 DUF3679 domain-containing protein [Pontibacillus sp. HMF3514]